MERSSLEPPCHRAISEGVEQSASRLSASTSLRAALIRLKTGELVAVVLASGLPDVLDHGFLLLVTAHRPHLGVSARHPSGRKTERVKCPSRNILASGIQDVDKVNRLTER